MSKYGGAGKMRKKILERGKDTYTRPKDISYAESRRQDMEKGHLSTMKEELKAHNKKVNESMRKKKRKKSFMNFLKKRMGMKRDEK